MATLTITNTTTADIWVRDLYAKVPASGSITVTRAASDLSRMAGLQSYMNAGSLTLSVTYSADELGSGLQEAPFSVGAGDMAPVASTDLASGLVLIRKIFTAGVAGSADDVTIYAVNTLPFKFRVVDAWIYVSTNIGASSANVWTRAGATGTQLAALSSGSTGRAGNTLTATASIAPAALDGLFVRRSDRGVAGEVVLLCRIES